MIPAVYYFDQLCAEAVHRISLARVAIYLTKAAAKVGWPIPAEDRYRVGAGLALMVQTAEQGVPDSSLSTMREVDR